MHNAGKREGARASRARGQEGLREGERRGPGGRSMAGCGHPEAAGVAGARSSGAVPAAWVAHGAPWKQPRSSWHRPLSWGTRLAGFPGSPAAGCFSGGSRRSVFLVSPPSVGLGGSVSSPAPPTSTWEPPPCAFCTLALISTWNVNSGGPSGPSVGPALGPSGSEAWGSVQTLGRKSTRRGMAPSAGKPGVPVASLETVWGAGPPWVGELCRPGET